MADSGFHETVWYTSTLERLFDVVRELSQARNMAAISSIVRDAARELTGADGAGFVLRDGDQCYYADENAITPLWKGKRFPMTACVSGWVMLNAQPAVIEDIYADPRVPAEAYRPTFVKSLAMVPIRRTEPVGAIGNYWSTHYRPTSQEVAILQALADTTSVALENSALYTRLQQQVQTLKQQQSRIQSQHASLQVFTSALAHDLKEPVRTLVSYSRILQEEPEQLEDAEMLGKRSSYMSYVHNAAERMDMLIGAVSRYVRLEEPAQPAPFCDLAQIVEGIRQDLAEMLAARGAKLITGNLPRVNADPAYMTQLLHNLILNAMVHNKAPVTICIRHVMRNGRAVCSLSDNGIGLLYAQTQQIFEPFRRLTHLAGCAGLGLAICRRIVELYGGEISCDSAPGSGATFTFSLPAPSLPAPEQAELEPSKHPAI